MVGILGISFASEIEKELFDQLVKERVCLEASSESQKQRADTLQYDLNCIHNSISFHIGRAITWLPRKVCGGVRCFRDNNGLGRTLFLVTPRILNIVWKRMEHRRGKIDGKQRIKQVFTVYAEYDRLE